MSIAPVKKLEVKDASDIAQHYGVPVSLVNLYFVEFNGRAYPMEPFLVRVTQKKGVQRMEISKPVQKDGQWEVECKIYPTMPAELLRVLPGLRPEEQKRLIEYHTAPTVEWGRASTANVHASTMHAWLPEIAIKRAVARCCRKFSGVDLTAYEELPTATIAESSRDAVDAQPLPEPAPAVPENGEEVWSCGHCQKIFQSLEAAVEHSLNVHPGMKADPKRATVPRK